MCEAKFDRASHGERVKENILLCKKKKKKTTEMKQKKKERFIFGIQYGCSIFSNARFELSSDRYTYESFLRPQACREE